MNIDPSEFALMKDGLTTTSGLDAAVLLSEISTRNVEDQDEKLEDDLGAVDAKVLGSLDLRHRSLLMSHR